MINLPFCTITRSKFESYKEYHTSEDNLNFINYRNLSETTEFLKKLILEIENSVIPISNIRCEPMLSKRKLYPITKSSASKSEKNKSKKILDFLSYSDNTNNLKNISELAKLSAKETLDIFMILKKNKLIKVS